MITKSTPSLCDTQKHMLINPPFENSPPPAPDLLQFVVTDDPLVVRRLIPTDAPALFDLISRNLSPLAESWFVNGMPPPESSDVVERRLIDSPLPEILPFGIWEGDTMVGRLDMVPRKEGKPTKIPTEATEAEVSFFVDNAHQGEAITTRAITIAMRGMSKLFGIDIFTAEVAKDNRYGPAAIRSIERIGFTKLPDSDGDEYLLFRRVPGQQSVEDYI